MNSLPRKTPAASLGSSLAGLAAARSGKPRLVASPAYSSHPVMKGGRDYLRALRAAEMMAWAASGGDLLRPASTN